MGFLGSLLNLGGVFSGSKTLIGLLSVAYYLIATYRPDYLPFIDPILSFLGIALLPIGIADKVLKKQVK